jgi:hypothetical protein
MIEIIDINDRLFSVNGVEYIKTFTSKVLGADNITIINAYDSKNVIVKPVSYENITLDGTAYNSNIELHNALKFVLFNVNNIGGEELDPNNIVAFFAPSNGNPNDSISKRVVDNLNQRTPDITIGVNQLGVLAAYYTVNGINYKQTWFLKQSGRSYGANSENVDTGILEPNTIQQTGGNSRTDFGDIGNTTPPETPEDHLDDFVDALNPTQALINGQLITATIDGIDYEWNFSGETGDYGNTGLKSEPSDFNRYETSNNADDEPSISQTSDIPVNDGEDGTSRYTQDAEILQNGKFKTELIPDLALNELIIATETTIAAFAANSANYTFQEGDVICIDDGDANGDGNRNVTHHFYKGGDKTNVNSYSQINATEFAISQVQGLQGELDNKRTKDKSYTLHKKLADIGITNGQETIQSIIDALGINEAISYSIGTPGFNESEYPVNRGTIFLYKDSLYSYGYWSSRNTNELYNASFNGNIFLQWDKIAYTSEVVKKTGEISQSVEGSLITDAFITKNGTPEQLVAGDGTLVEKNLSSFNDDIGATNPKVYNTAFIDTVNGDDATARLEDALKPFKTLDAAILAYKQLEEYEPYYSFIVLDNSKQVISEPIIKDITRCCV